MDDNLHINLDTAEKCIIRCTSRDRKRRNILRRNQRNLGNARKYELYILMNITAIMEITDKFEGYVLDVNERENGVRDIKLLNEKNGEETSIPEWCLTDFVHFPNNVLDDEQHIKKGSTLKLWKMENGKIFPDYTAYQRKEKKTIEPTANLKHMSHDNLFEGTSLYAPKTLDELQQLFAERNAVTPFSPTTVRQTITLMAKGNEAEKTEFLAGLLGVSSMKLSSQESNTLEYKTSFLHCSKPVRNERAAQYQQIFQAITSFGNSHREGRIFIGVNNNGEVVGIEKELESETYFDNRADFQKDFKNTLTQCIGNYAFTSSIEFRWYKTEDMKLFCEIRIPEWNGDILFLNGSEIYVRDEAGKRQLKNKDIIDFIINKYGKAA